MIEGIVCCLQSFVSDFGSVLIDSSFDKEVNLQEINQVVYEHFLRQGMLDIAQSLITVSTTTTHTYSPFSRSHLVVGSLQQTQFSSSQFCQSWTSSFLVPITFMFSLTSTCFGLPLFLLPGGTISRVFLPM